MSEREFANYDKVVKNKRNIFKNNDKNTQNGVMRKDYTFENTISIGFNSG